MKKEKGMQQHALVGQIIEKTLRGAIEGQRKIRSAFDSARSRSPLCDVILPGITPLGR
jgi:hypothetical protein